MLGVQLNQITRKQCCVWSCGIAVAIALITPPIAIFVVTPFIAQKIMYGTEIALSSSTLYPCVTNYTWMLNTAKIHVPGPFGASLHPYETIIKTTTCPNPTNPEKRTAGTSCKDPDVTVLGTYTSPVMNLESGHNGLDFQVGMHLTDVDAVMNAFILPMFFGGHETELTIESQAIDMVASLKLLGLNIGIKVKAMKLFNQLTCSKVKLHSYRGIPDTICHPELTTTEMSPPTMTSAATMAVPSAPTKATERRSMMGRRLDDGTGYEIKCVPGAPQWKKASSLNIFA